MNGDSAGLEPTDSSGAIDTRARRWEARNLLREAEATLEALGEYKAAREVGDAGIRLQSTLEADEARERQRRSKALHGEDPQNAEVTSG